MEVAIVLMVLIVLEIKNRSMHLFFVFLVVCSVFVSCDRKTIARNIGYLREYGCNIVTIKGKGCYMKSYPLLGVSVPTNTTVLEKNSGEN